VPASVGTVLCDASSGAVVINLPTLASSYTTIGGSSSGREIKVTKKDSSGNACTPTGNGAENINGSNTHAITTQYSAYIYSAGPTEWSIF
jgi:hypothetical protein